MPDEWVLFQEEFIVLTICLLFLKFYEDNVLLVLNTLNTVNFLYVYYCF